MLYASMCAWSVLLVLFFFELTQLERKPWIYAKWNLNVKLSQKEASFFFFYHSASFPMREQSLGLSMPLLKLELYFIIMSPWEHAQWLCRLEEIFSLLLKGVTYICLTSTYIYSICNKRMLSKELYCFSCRLVLLILSIINY